MIGVLVAAVAGYLLGSVPFGLVLTRAAGLGDIRAIGSGNIGATNVLRTGNKGLAAATLLLDGGKGLIAVLLARWLIGGDAVYVAGAGAMLGHTFPVWLGFKGGKGVATAMGSLLAMAWPVGLIACLTWLVVAAVFRVSSLSALVALATASVVAALSTDTSTTVATLAIAILVYIRHKANIRRLLRGEEPKMTFGKARATN